MEDVYTIKVKTKPDVRNLYPSERRYSASTVSGLAWIHIALAATTFLLSCLTLVYPDSENSTVIQDANSTSIDDNSYVLVLAPSLITFFALATGLTAILASIRWYIDRNITWFFVTSVASTFVSLMSFFTMAIWLLTDSSQEIENVFILKHSDVIEKNETHFIIAKNITENKEGTYFLTDRVLSVNILIAAFLEFLWSLLSIRISYRGMKNTYNVDENRGTGNCVQVVTKIKGDMNNIKKGRLNPNKKIKRIFLAQGDNGFYLKNQNCKAKNTETSSEFYKERMMNFLNRCASLEGVSNPDHTPSVQSEVNPKPEPNTPNKRVTPVSWGDSPEHTVYNQNTLNFERIFNFKREDKADKEENTRDVSRL